MNLGENQCEFLCILFALVGDNSRKGSSSPGFWRSMFFRYSAFYDCDFCVHCVYSVYTQCDDARCWFLGTVRGVEGIWAVESRWRRRKGMDNGAERTRFRPRKSHVTPQVKGHGFLASDPPLRLSSFRRRRADSLTFFSFFFALSFQTLRTQNCPL